MSRNYFDAKCLECKREIIVLIGNPLLCGECLFRPKETKTIERPVFGKERLR